MKVYRIPFSTNVERVALAAGHKGVPIEWADIDPDDRGEVERLSGQPLVPVLVDDDRVVVDSTEILRYLEQVRQEPALFPADAARRAELDVFIEWLNRVWKRPPNQIAAERAKDVPDEARIGRLGAQLAAWLDLFESLLDGRDYLLGEFSAADCAAFPFLKYALVHDPADTEPFHLILREFQPLGDDHPRLEAWIRRVDGLPRA